jgi:hypothetical protein
MEEEHRRAREEEERTKTIEELRGEERQERMAKVGVDQEAMKSFWEMVRRDVAPVRRDPKRAPDAKRLIKGKSLIVTHSQSGWMNEEICKQCVDWPREYLTCDDGDENGPPWIGLIWDRFSAHCKQSIMDRCTSFHIDVAYIPAGQTGTWQPLDYRIFGILKPRARVAWMHEKERQEREGREAPFTMLWAVVMLVRVWNEIEKVRITEAWNIF